VPPVSLHVGAAAAAATGVVALVRATRTRRRGVPHRRASCIRTTLAGGTELPVVWRRRCLSQQPAIQRLAQLVEQKQEAQSGALLGHEDIRNSRPLWPGMKDVFEDFGGLEIPKRVKDALQELDIVRPSGIQELVMSRVAGGESVIAHAPTGGGKTLAFLLPLFARLQPTQHVGIQLLILVPSPELALQITREAKWLAEVCCGESGNCWFNPQVPRDKMVEVLLSRSALWDAIRQDTAILVTTPSLIVSELIALQWQAVRFTETLAYWMGSNIDAIVMDEVDSMLSDLPAKQKKVHKKKLGPAERVVLFVFDIVRNRYRNRQIQLVCASATANSGKVQRSLEELVEKKYPKRRDLGRRKAPVLVQHNAITTPAAGIKLGLKPHVAVPQGITHYYWLLKEDDDRFGTTRLNTLVDVVSKLTGTILVFVPEEIKLSGVVVHLQENGIPHATKYRSSIGLGLDVEALADEELRRTLRAKHPGEAVTDQKYGAAPVLERSQEFVDSLAAGDRKVLVAKAEMARGIDLKDVRYVVLFRLPKTANTYLHLAGRTGRMDKEGTVVSLCTRTDIGLVIPVVEARLGIKFQKFGTAAKDRKLRPKSDTDGEVEGTHDDELPDGHVQRVIKYSAKERGRIVGRQGCIIKRIRYDSNASIEAGKTDTETGNAQIVVRGLPDEVTVAVGMMEAAAENRLPRIKRRMAENSDDEEMMTSRSVLS